MGRYLCWSRILAPTACVSAIAAIFAPTTAAGPPAPATGTTVLLSRQIVDVREVDGGLRVTAVASRSINGTITGTIRDDFTVAAHPDGTVNVHSIATCTCAVAGRAGVFKFVFNGTGTVVPAVLSGHAGSFGPATGALRGIHVELEVQTVGDVSHYSGTYHFDP